MSLLEKILQNRENIQKSDYEDLTPVKPNSYVNSNNTFINIQFNLVVTLVVFSSIIIVCLFGFLISICLPKKMIPKNCRKLRRDNTIYDFHSVSVQPQRQLIRQVPPPLPASSPPRILNINKQQKARQQVPVQQQQQLIEHQINRITKLQNDQESIITIDPSVVILSEQS